VPVIERARHGTAAGRHGSRTVAAQGRAFAHELDRDGRPGVFAEELCELPLATQQPQRISDFCAQRNRQVLRARQGLKPLPRDDRRAHDGRVDEADVLERDGTPVMSQQSVIQCHWHR